MDERLRALERRWRTSGSPDDGAAWLVARLAAKTLAPARLELAALCGEEAARLARPRPATLLDADELADALRRTGLQHGSPAVRRWLADGLPGDGGRFDPVEVLAWLARSWQPQLERLTLLWVHERDPLAALRLLWATLRARRGDHDRWAPFLAAFEACLADPTLDDRRRAAAALADGLGRPAEGLCRTLEQLPDLHATLAALAAFGQRVRLARHFAAGRAALAAWALSDAPPAAWSAPYAVRSHTTYTPRHDWYDDGGYYTTFHRVIDRRTGATVRSIDGDDVTGVELTDDQRQVVVRRGERVERLDLPPV